MNIKQAYAEGFSKVAESYEVDPGQLYKAAVSLGGIFNSFGRGGKSLVAAAERMLQASQLKAARKAVEAAKSTRSVALNNANRRWLNPEEFGKSISKATPTDIVSGSRVNDIVNGSMIGQTSPFDEMHARRLVGLGKKRLAIESGRRGLFGPEQLSDALRYTN